MPPSNTYRLNLLQQKCAPHDTVQQTWNTSISTKHETSMSSVCTLQKLGGRGTTTNTMSQIHHYKGQREQLDNYSPQEKPLLHDIKIPQTTSYINHHENLKAYRTEEYTCTYLSVMGLLHWGSLFRELLTRVATGCHVSTLAGWIADRAAFGGTLSTSNQSCDIPKCKSQNIIAPYFRQKTSFDCPQICACSHIPLTQRLITISWHFTVLWPVHMNCYRDVRIRWLQAVTEHKSFCVDRKHPFS